MRKVLRKVVADDFWDHEDDYHYLMSPVIDRFKRLFPEGCACTASNLEVLLKAVCEGDIVLFVRVLGTPDGAAAGTIEQAVKDFYKEEWSREKVYRDISEQEHRELKLLRQVHQRRDKQQACELNAQIEDALNPLRAIRDKKVRAAQEEFKREERRIRLKFAAPLGRQDEQEEAAIKARYAVQHDWLKQAWERRDAVLAELFLARVLPIYAIAEMDETAKV